MRTGTSGKIARLEKDFKLNLDWFSPNSMARSPNFFTHTHTQVQFFVAVWKKHPVSFSKEEDLQQQCWWSQWHNRRKDWDLKMNSKTAATKKSFFNDCIMCVSMSRKTTKNSDDDTVLLQKTTESKPLVTTNARKSKIACQTKTILMQIGIFISLLQLLCCHLLLVLTICDVFWGHHNG